MKKKSRKLSKTIIIFVLVLVCFSARAGLFASADSYFHCWSCGCGDWSRSKTPNCPECGWDICPNCGACSKSCSRMKYTRNSSKEGSTYDEGPADAILCIVGMLALALNLGIGVVSTISDIKFEKKRARIEAENAKKPKQTNSYSSNTSYFNSTVPTPYSYSKPQASYPYAFKEGNVLTHISFGKCRVVQVNEKIIQMQVISTGEQKKILNDPSVAKFFEATWR